MRLFSFALCGIGCLLCAPAFAQTATVMPAGSCTGTVTADITFAARKQGETAITPVAATYAPNVYGKAECDCDPSEDSGDALYMNIQISKSLPIGTVTTATAWVGSGCDDYSTRINTSAVSCRQIMPSALSSSVFSAGSGFNVTNPLQLYVPARLLFSPSTGSCEVDGSNTIWIFIGTNQQTPDGTCKVSVAQRAIGASPPVKPTAASGDSAINLSWTAPTTSNTTSLRAAAYYQLLCAGPDNKPVKTTANAPGYSACLADGTIRRRQNIFGASNVTVSTSTDGGVVDMLSTSSASGLGSSSSALSAGSGSGPAWPRATDDMGTDDMNTADLATPTTNPLDTAPRPTSYPGIEPFTSLDPAFICSDLIAATGLDFTQRIGDLVNGVEYSFLIVAIDDYGNPTPSTLITATPKPVDDLYSRLRNSGSTAQGFCFVATAAYGDYDHPQVRVLREFRDRILAPTALGRAFIRGYYAASPPLAHFIERSPVRRFIARMILWPLVGFAALALSLGSFLLALVVAIGAPGGLLWLRRRRVRRRALVEVRA